MRTYDIGQYEGCFDIPCPSCGMEPGERHGKVYAMAHLRSCELLGYRIMALPHPDPETRKKLDEWRKNSVEPR